jgi:chemotaxis signal transduction protein
VKIGKLERRKPRPAPHGEMMILFKVSSHTLAIAAQAVEEIRNHIETQPLGLAGGGKVRHVFKREGKTYYIVDAGAHLRVGASRPTRLMLLREATVGLSVDSIAGMAEVRTVQKLPRAFQGAECTWYRGLAIVGPQVVPVINPQTLLTEVELAELGGGKSIAGAATA